MIILGLKSLSVKTVEIVDKTVILGWGSVAQYLPGVFKALGSYTAPLKSETKAHFVVLCSPGVTYTLCTLYGITVITIIHKTHFTGKTMCEAVDHPGSRNSFSA